MIRALANRVLEFDNGSEKVTTKIGFCELPNWVGQTPFYKAALLDGSIKSFESTSPREQEEIVKANEKLDDLLNQHKELEEKIETTEIKGKEKIASLKEEIAALEAQKEELAASTKPTQNSNRR